MELETKTVIKKTAEEKSATFISFILHPLLMPTYGFLLIFFTKNYISVFTPMNYKVIIIAATFLFTFLLPTINALILLKMGRIKSLEMETSSERIIPYSSAAIYYFALFYMFYQKQLPAIFIILILGATISIVLTLIINYRWKISAHTIGIGGIAGATLGIMYRMQMDLSFIFIIVILFAGIVSYARLKLDAHTPAQVYTGLLMGFMVELLLMLFY